MKEKIKFIIVIISLLLLSSIILTGCMLAIAADNGKPKPYNLQVQTNTPTDDIISPDEEVPSYDHIIEDAPQAQSPLIGKFKEYIHEEENAVTVFSKEQYEELKSIRNDGKRVPLTYDEVIFLINDSINMYFSYDEIRLYNACVDHILQLRLSLASLQSSNTCFIYPYHGDFSEFETFYDAKLRYDRMIEEIYGIIYYRIYMHDAGFETVHHAYYSGKHQIFGDRYNAHLGQISGAVPLGGYQMLAIDGADFSGIENEEKLVNEYTKIAAWESEHYTNHIDPDKKFQKLNSKILKTKIINDLRQPLEYTFCIYDSDNTVQIVYPTPELKSMEPHLEFYYEANTAYSTSEHVEIYRPVFSLNYENKTFSMSASAYMSFALIGPFDEQDGVLKLYPKNAGDYGVYSYVFHKSGDNYVYIPKDSKPIETGGFDWIDEIVFEMVHMGVSNAPVPAPPANDEPVTPLPNIPVENETAALKFVPDGDYCSLMFQGNGVIDGGSYVKDDCKMVFLFKTSYGVYQYYFEHLKENMYVYIKGESEPVPGYEFEDGTKFVLITFKDSTSCYLKVDSSENNPTSVEPMEYSRYYPDELFGLYDLSKIVSWEEIYAAEELLKNNEYFYNEQLPPLYLMIRHLNISKRDFIKASESVSLEQIEWLFSDADIPTIMINLKADWAFHYKGKLYNIYELAEMNKDMLIEFKNNGELDEYIAYMDSLDEKFEALEYIKNSIK